MNLNSVCFLINVVRFIASFSRVNCSHENLARHVLQHYLAMSRKNCDVYQRCINSCAESVRSFGAEEITPEQFKAKMDKLNEQLQTIFAKELKSSHDTGNKFSPEEDATLTRSLEDIFNWTVAQTILRTRIPGSAPPTQRQLEEMREDMKATEDSLRSACPNITNPKIQ
jgi:hypothetical protein